MLVAAIAATAAGISAIVKKTGPAGLLLVAAFLGLILYVQCARRSSTATQTDSNDVTRE
jgi:hypothetical protein